MADTELQGVLKLTLDKTEVDKGVKDIGTSASGSAAKAGTGTGKNLSTKFAEELKKQIAGSMRSMFSGFGRVGNAFGNTVDSFFSSSSSGAASGKAGAASAGGGGAAEGAAAGSAAGGPIGLVIAAAVAVFYELVKTVTRAVERLMSFARGLAEVSASMGMAFGIFDMQMLLLKQQLGEALAPAIRELLNQVFLLAREAMPIIIFAFKTLANLLTFLAEVIRNIPGVKLLEYATSHGVDSSGHFGSTEKGGTSWADILVEMIIPVKGIYDIIKWWRDTKDDETVLQPGTGGMLTSFSDILQKRNAQMAADRDALVREMTAGGVLNKMMPRHHAPFGAGGGMR